MRCDEIMKSPGERVLATDTCQLAAQRMREANVGFLPVCDAKGDVIGALTDRDMALRLVAEGRPSRTKVWEVMSRELVSCRTNDDILEAGRLMGERAKSRIVVLDDDDHLAGVISLSDLAQNVDEFDTAETLRKITEREATTSALA